MRHGHVVGALGLTAGLLISSNAFAWRGPTPDAAPQANGPQATGPARLEATLDTQDPVDAEGHPASAHDANLEAGDVVEVAAGSSQFDTVLTVLGPNGFRASNDDAQGEGTNSRVRFVAPVRGAYRALVTAYQGRGEGPFELSLTRIVPAPQWTTPTAAPRVAPATTADATQPVDPAATVPHATHAGNVYGVFVGIGDYSGANHSLAYTARDALSLEGAFERRGLILPGNAVVLTDAQATGDAVRRAFATLAPRVGPDDTFVFFFDGHGASQAIELRDGNLGARDLDRMLDRVRGEQLVVLDSCESGGLASITRGQPHRLGLFSSRADESSYEAPAVGAGGWLAYFVLQSVRTGQGPITFGHLADDVRRGYASRVRNGQHVVIAAGDERTAENLALWDAERPATNTPTVASREMALPGYPAKH